jgi:hypothetical protein
MLREPLPGAARTIAGTGLLLTTALALAGCGGVVAARHPANGSQHRLPTLGFELQLPAGWSSRALIGAEGRPVLHAASFPLPSNDNDSGEVAQETIGGRGQLYLNVREHGPGKTGSSLPISFERSDFGPPPPGPGSRCCFVTVASREVAASGHLYRVTVTSGSREPPPEGALTELNALLATLALSPYEPGQSRKADGERLTRHGVELTLPRGWHGRVSSGLVEAASYQLPRDADPAALLPPARHQIALRLEERGGSDAPFVTARLPLELAPSEFVAPAPGSGEHVAALSGRSFVASGRKFVLWVFAGSVRPDATALAEANEALATLRVEPGDFYPGQVEPATFAPAPGWYTGTGGPAKIEPAGEQTDSWASTVPYGDPPNQFPPHATLAALPADGIAIVAWLARHPSNRSELPAGRPPFQLTDAQRGPFEGVPPTFATYQIGAYVPGRFDVVLWVFFGRAHPPSAQLDRAQAELERLRLPGR